MGWQPVKMGLMLNSASVRVGVDARIEAGLSLAKMK